MMPQHLEEEEKLKKKNSLKEMLKNKKSLLSYKTSLGDNKNSILKKSTKDYEFCSSTKENKNIYGKFI